MTLRKLLMKKYPFIENLVYLIPHFDDKLNKHNIYFDCFFLSLCISKMIPVLMTFKLARQWSVISELKNTVKMDRTIYEYTEKQGILPAKSAMKNLLPLGGLNLKPSSLTCNYKS